MLKKFLVKIWAYDHCASFEVKAEDNAESIEKSILDKIGEKSIKWESAGMYKDIPNRITYEEVIDATTSQRLIQAEEKSRDRMGGSSAR